MNKLKEKKEREANTIVMKNKDKIRKRSTKSMNKFMEKKDKTQEQGSIE